MSYIKPNLKMYECYSDETYKVIIELQLEHLKGNISFDTLYSIVGKFLYESGYYEDNIRKVQRILIDVDKWIK